MDPSPRRTANKRKSDGECSTPATPFFTSKRTKRTPLAEKQTRKSARSEEMADQNSPTPSQGDAIVERLVKHFDKKSDEAREHLDSCLSDLGNQIKTNSTNIESMNRAIKKLEEEKDNISPALERKIEELVGTRSAAKQQTAFPFPPEDKTPDQSAERMNKYNASRRSIRIWPVVPLENDDYHMKIAVGKFLAKMMKVPADDLDLGKIERARKALSGRRQTRIKDEVLVTFVSISHRDYIMSHAKNLASYHLSLIHI